MKIQEFFDKETARYSDWFGDGDTHNDAKDMIKDHGEPDEILTNNIMVVGIYSDKVIVVGYDGSEYFQSFKFDRP